MKKLTPAESTLSLEELLALPPFQYDRSGNYAICTYRSDLAKAEAFWTIGDRDEAWRQLNNLVLAYLHGDPIMVCHYHECVFKRMSKLLNREGRYLHAFAMALAAHYSRLIHHYRRGAYESLLAELSDGAMEKALGPRARKVGATALFPEIVKIFSDGVRRCPDYAIGRVLREIDTLLARRLPHART